MWVIWVLMIINMTDYKYLLLDEKIFYCIYIFKIESFIKKYL